MFFDPTEQKASGLKCLAGKKRPKRGIKDKNDFSATKKISRLEFLATSVEIIFGAVIVTTAITFLNVQRVASSLRNRSSKGTDVCGGLEIQVVPQTLLQLLIGGTATTATTATAAATHEASNKIFIVAWL